MTFEEKLIQRKRYLTRKPIKHRKIYKFIIFRNRKK